MTDAELCQAIRAGDPGAIDLLVERYTPLVWKIALGFAAKWPRHDRDDLAQTGFLTLVRCGRNFREDGGAKFITYVWNSIGRQIARHIYRAGTRERLRGERRLAGRHMDGLRDGSRPAWELVDLADDIDEMRWTIRELCPRDRQALEDELAGLNGADAARLRGCSRENIRQIRCRARKNLARLMRPTDLSR